MTTVCRDWHAWLNTMPPKPDDFHVAGDVLVSNPGVEPLLTMREPQGINPAVLILDMHLVQRPGAWPAVMTCQAATFQRVMPPGAPNYQSVEVYSDGTQVAFIDHVEVAS